MNPQELMPPRVGVGFPESEQDDNLEAHVPAFEELAARKEPDGSRSLSQILDVSCCLTAELGRLQISISDVLKMAPGFVVELDRLVSEPVDLVIQGVKFARGEVVVVNDHFAIRIKEIVDPKRRG